MELNPETLKILNLKPNQRFAITGPWDLLTKWTPDRIYYFDERLVLYYASIGSDDFSPSMYCKDILYQLLTDPEITIKPIIIPTREDYITLSYFKLAGYKYIAMDKDGAIWAFKHKPKKLGGVWGLTNPPTPSEQKGVIETRCETPISFLTFEDLEPYPLDDL